MFCFFFPLLGKAFLAGAEAVFFPERMSKEVCFLRLKALEASSLVCKACKQRFQGGMFVFVFAVGQVNEVSVNKERGASRLLCILFFARPAECLLFS